MQLSEHVNVAMATYLKYSWLYARQVHGHGIQRRPRPRKQAPGDVYSPRRARLDKKGASVQACFLYFCGHCYIGVIFHFFKHTPGQNMIEYLYLTLNQPFWFSSPNPKQTLYLSHFSPIISFLSIIISLH